MRADAGDREDGDSVGGAGDARTAAPPAAPDAGMARDGELAELCVRAVTVAAHDLGLDPLLLVEELAQGEIGMMIHLLDQAAPHVKDFDLRLRIEALVHRLTAWTEGA